MTLSSLQSSYSRAPSEGVAGAMAYGRHNEVVTRVAKTTAGIAPGYGCIKGTNPGEAVLSVGSPTDADFLGVALYQEEQETGFTYATGSLISIVKDSPGIWVPCASVALVTDGPVYLIKANANAGKFAGGAGSGDDAAVLLTGVKCVQGAAAGSLAILSLRKA